MEWAEVEVHTVNEAIEPIANLLTERGASGVAITDAADFYKERENKFGEIYSLNQADYPSKGVVIKAYFLQTGDFLNEVNDIEKEIFSLSQYGIQLGELKFFVNEVQDEKWATAWKKYYHPVQITENIVIVPTWEEYQAKPHEMIIELDPGMAFGTGTHPTTQLCLRALDTYLKPGMKVIDVGTGSGVLSIASAKLGADDVLATDLDEVAVRAAQENVDQNHVSDKVVVRQNNLLANIHQNADIIVANILAEVILLFPKDVYHNLRPGGLFIASGIIEQKAEVVREALIEAGLSVIKTEQQGDWVAIISERGES